MRDFPLSSAFTCEKDLRESSGDCQDLSGSNLNGAVQFGAIMTFLIHNTNYYFGSSQTYVLTSLWQTFIN